MAHSNQARKRIRQNQTNRLRNKTRISIMRSRMKAALDAAGSGDKDQASALASAACKSIDKAAKHSVIHANKAARHKGQIMKAVGSM